MPIERLNPGDLHQPSGYTHVVRTRGTTIYIAGQVALDTQGNLVGPGDLGAQARQVFRNLGSALAAAGAGFEDVVKMTTYIVDYAPEKRDAYRAARSEFISGALPASTLVGVQALAQAAFLIEIEAVAVLDG
jgi:enamine deaminase RidA (YjgF/YER057c/UK114 family)